MPAGLDYRDDDRAAVLLARQSAWHNEGTVIEDDHPALRDLDLAMEIAGVDFEVAKYPHYVKLPDGSFREAPGSNATVRLDRDEVIGSVGDTYTPLQNRDAFGVIRPVLEEGLAEIETMGSLRDGSQVWGLFRIDTQAIVDRAAEESKDAASAVDETFHGDDPALPYALFTNDHSGRMKARVQETLIRVVCANTYDAAAQGFNEGVKVEIRHVGNVVENYRSAAAILLGSLTKRYVASAWAERQLRRIILEPRAFDRLVLDTAVPVAHLEKKIQRREGTAFTETALEKAGAKRSRIRDLWIDGRGHVGDGNAWEAFQAVVEWADHEETGARDRISSLHDGLLRRIKRDTQSRLIAYANGDEETRAAILS